MRWLQGRSAGRPSRILRQQIRQHFRRMAPGRDRLVGLEDLSLFVDEVTDPFSVTGLGIVAGAIGEADRAGGVTQEGEGKAEFLRESGVFRHRIETHSEYFYILRTKIGNLVAEPAAFSSSTRGVRFGVKP